MENIIPFSHFYHPEIYCFFSTLKIQAKEEENKIREGTNIVLTIVATSLGWLKEITMEFLTGWMEC